MSEFEEKPSSALCVNLIMRQEGVQIKPMQSVKGVPDCQGVGLVMSAVIRVRTITTLPGIVDGHVSRFLHRFAGHMSHLNIVLL